MKMQLDVIAGDKSAEQLPSPDVAAAKVAADDDPGLVKNEHHPGLGQPFTAFRHHKTSIVQAVSGFRSRQIRLTSGLPPNVPENETADCRRRRRRRLSLFHGLMLLVCLIVRRNRQGLQGNAADARIIERSENRARSISSIFQ